jgi:glycosyltransferase involved in cell wall biosynthesis
VPYHAFEGIDVLTGDEEQLKTVLRSGQVKHLLAHLLDDRMWRIVREFLDDIRLTIWVHGAEIDTWQKRLFDFEHAGELEMERQKKLSAKRMKMWHEIVDAPHPNVHLVFISQSFQNEALANLGLANFPPGQVSVIHNFVNGELFVYHEKEARHRLNILSIRSFGSKKYANDLTVKAILELSKRLFFHELSFRIVGDGELFEETVEPLRNFGNVHIDRGFLTQRAIVELQKDYGIFLCPTRHDAQGVSRDEAMAAGLVPITNRVAAIPEFVDEKCGLLVPPEDYMGLADAVESLYRDPELFLRLSKAAAERVRRQSGFDRTIAKEISLITG